MQNRSRRPIAAAAAAAALLLVGVATVGTAQSAQAAQFVSSAVIVDTNSLFSPSTPPGSLAAARAGSVLMLSTSSLVNGVDIFVPGATDAVSYQIEVLPPAGQKLAVGRYSGLSSTSSDPTRAKLNVTVGDVTQATSIGEVDVLDIAANPNGTIKRFDIVFRTGDASPSNILFGEMRLGQPGDTSATLAARNLEWPQTPVHSPPVFATEWIQNPTAKSVPIGAAAVSAGARSDYTVSSDGCSNTTLAARSSCSLKIGFSPTTAGPRDATLTVAVGGASQTVSLSGNATLGANTLTISGRDYVDGNATHVLGGSQYTVVGIPSVGGFSFTPIAPNGTGAPETTATARFAAPGGGPLAVGTHDAVSFISSTYPYATTKQYGVSVFGFGRGCGDNTGTITVRSFVVAADGSPSMVDLSFTQKCLNEANVMTGTLQYHSRADTTAPATVTGLSVTGSTTPTASWKPSSSTDVSFTIARLVAGDGSNATPTSGYALSANTLSSAPLPALTAGQRYTVLVFAVDTAGNYSASASVAVTG